MLIQRPIFEKGTQPTCLHGFGIHILTIRPVRTLLLHMIFWAANVACAQSFVAFTLLHFQHVAFRRSVLTKELVVGEILVSAFLTV